MDVESLKGKKPNVRARIKRTPGHNGHRRQDAVDALAKSAARDSTTKTNCKRADLKKAIPTSVAALRMREGKRTKKAQEEATHNASQRRKYRHTDPEGPNKKFGKYTRILDRSQLGILIQLRTGHIALNDYLHGINKAPDPKCPKCSEPREITQADRRSLP